MTPEVTTPCPVCGRPFPGSDLIPVHDCGAWRKAQAVTEPGRSAAVPREIDQRFPLVDDPQPFTQHAKKFQLRQRASALRKALEEILSCGVASSDRHHRQLVERVTNEWLEMLQDAKAE